MRHIPVVPPHRANGLVRQVYRQMERDFGMHAPPISLHSLAPTCMAAAWLMLRETLLATGCVTRAEKEAVAAAVSRANACPYCVDVHQASLRGLTGTRDRGHASSGALTDPAVLAAAPPPHRAELIGTAVTFHYLNRMVNVFLVESPIPSGTPAAARRVIDRLTAAALRGAVRRPVEPGRALPLLPAAPPDGAGWAVGVPTVADAFARASQAVEEAGRRSVPAATRERVAAAVAGWDGSPPGLSAGWARAAAATLPEEQRAVGRLALLAAMASYQIGPAAIDEFRQERPSGRQLLEVTSWASLTAARHLAARHPGVQDRNEDGGTGSTVH